jgi:hypothetical protein
VAAFPAWSRQPLVQPPVGDLVYPDWLAGTWEMTSTLVEQVAPLAPDLITPGFEDNRAYLDQPILSRVRFIPAPVAAGKFLNQSLNTATGIVSDRAFNGFNLARAYLGDDGIKAVKIDPDNPNRQLTLLSGEQQLISTVTGRAVEAPGPDRLITTELFQQVFRGGGPAIYLNQVENTTAYYRQPLTNGAAVWADQLTAVYLSPQDPAYFQARQRPVALYRYRLEFRPVNQ